MDSDIPVPHENNDTPPPMTTSEKREKRIEQLKAQVQKETAKLVADRRKERNGQLIAFGLLVEAIYKEGDEDTKKKIADAASRLLDDRNAVRALAGLRRLAEEKKTPGA